MKQDVGANADTWLIDFQRATSMADETGGQVRRTDLVWHRDAESVGDRCEYSGAFMSAGDTPATILCLPWKDWTVNSSRLAGVDPLTADQEDQWRRTDARRVRDGGGKFRS